MEIEQRPVQNNPQFSVLRSQFTIQYPLSSTQQLAAKKLKSNKTNQRRFSAPSAHFGGERDLLFLFALLEGRGPRDQNGRRASAPPRVSCGRVSVKNRLVLVLVLVLVLESLFFTRRHEAAKTERETRIPSIQYQTSSIKHPKLVLEKVRIPVPLFSQKKTKKTKRRIYWKESFLVSFVIFCKKPPFPRSTAAFARNPR
jgi:hypothetical protein